MDKKEKIYGTVAIVGEIIVLISAAAWITKWGGVNYMYAFGATLFAIGRFSGYSKHIQPTAGVAQHKSSDLVLRRLYRQQIFGNIMLLLSAFIMNVHPGFYWGIFVSSTSWLIFFTVFVVYELYTTFRISYLTSKKE